MLKYTQLLGLALLVSFNSFGQTTEQFLDSGISKANLGDYYGAISDITKSIELASERDDDGIVSFSKKYD